MEFHEPRLAGGVHQPERMDAEALHHPEASRDGTVGHRPHDHVRRFRRERDEVPERVVRGPGLRHLEVRLGLRGMEEVGEFHRVLDEEHRDVVADQVEVAFVGVELDGEAPDVAGEIGGAAFSDHRREAYEHRRALAGFCEQRGARHPRERLVAFETAVRPRTARVHYALGNALVIEMGDLLAEDEVLEQRGPPKTGLERVLVVGDWHTLVRRQHPAARVNANAVERTAGGIDTGRRNPAAHLVCSVYLGERAPCRGRIGGFHRDSGGRIARKIAVLACFVGVIGHRRRERLGCRSLGNMCVHGRRNGTSGFACIHVDSSLFLARPVLRRYRSIGGSPESCLRRFAT